ncbi:MAG TPA: ABC transporter permease [Candidatus Angelobacter sp.]
MAIPVIYNFRSVKARWNSALVAVLGIAGSVGVFVAMLSLANGFKATLVSSGSPENALILRAGSTSEMDSSIDLKQLRIIEEAAGIARSAEGPLVSPEVVVIRPFPLRSTGTDANVQVRGVSLKALKVRNVIKMVEGRFFEPGVSELVVGRNAVRTYSGLSLGDTVKFGGGTWHVVGIFEAAGSAFESEVWCDFNVLNQVYHYPADTVRSVTAHLTSADALKQLKDSLTANPLMTVDVATEVAYYDKQSTRLTEVIHWLGTIIAIIMGAGAIFGALNTMYSAVVERGREIATMRALGFGGLSVITSFMIEALLISFVGGVVGCLAVLPVNGLTTGAMNWQTFSYLAFAFRVTPTLMLWGICFALIMGIVGGVPPAFSAARRPVAAALRSL